MKFDILSLFPAAFQSYFDVSILKRAQDAGVISLQVLNPRDFTHDKHRTTDDVPYGGGPGMVMKPEPIFECIESVLADGDRSKTRIILLSAKGKQFTQADATRLSQYERVMLICGRYEGVDERVALHLADEELAVGEYVLTGGELPAMIIVDAVTRLLPHVLGNVDSPIQESFSEVGLLEYPQYTRPESFRGWDVPEVLRSGNHAAIEKWRTEHMTRPDKGHVTS